jgi:hypothetical protein
MAEIPEISAERIVTGFGETGRQAIADIRNRVTE